MAINKDIQTQELDYPDMGDDINDLWYFNEEAENEDEEETEFVKQLFKVVDTHDII